ncbi:hypothetical protein [Gracilibacillus alcaliphilus]|uniref:hypothetical protein n=1 Tax=Gracilibacillus alcaliphilus TaxID=1401441 RepID=UPI00195D262C|nr:hypothetical protein [Gracilibacillus alcaliphilus]MBM7675299.1 hypothetical protein [Gracilibacillus alcaliphilus]
MNGRMNLYQGEKVLSTLTGLFESFDGMQTFYFGDLLLTNKRLYVKCNRFINTEESLWFGEEVQAVDQSTFIVGEHKITVKWTYNGNLPDFIKKFQTFNA